VEELMKGWIPSLVLLGTVGCSTLNQTLPDLPYKTVTVQDGTAILTGGWVFEDMGKQSQSTEIFCDRSTDTCEEVTAILSYNSGSSLDIDRVNYEIIEWSDQSVTAFTDEYDCVRYTLTIDSESKSVTKLRTKKNNLPECSGIASELLVTLKGNNES
jgi:hypothetical protein